MRGLGFRGLGLGITLQADKGAKPGPGHGTTTGSLPTSHSPDVGALTIGLWGILYDTCLIVRNPRNSIGNCQGLYSILQLAGRLKRHFQKFAVPFLGFLATTFKVLALRTRGSPQPEVERQALPSPSTLLPRRLIGKQPWQSSE